MRVVNVLVAIIIVLLILIVIYALNRSETQVMEPIVVNPITEIAEKAIDDHFTKLQRHEVDNQNSHDSVVIGVLKKKYNRLLELQDPNTSGLDDAEYLAVREQTTLRELRKLTEKHPKSVLITRVLNTFAKANSISSLDPDHPTTDLAILTLVWSRIHQGCNQKVQKEMTEVLLSQLADCIEAPANPILLAGVALLGGRVDSTGMVCTNGRVGRVLSALTNIDTDPVLAEPERDYNDIRNSVLWKAANMVKDAWKDEEFKSLYTQPEDFLDEGQLKRLRVLEAKLRDRMAEEIWKDYAEYLKADEIVKLIEEVKAGV